MFVCSMIIWKYKHIQSILFNMKDEGLSSKGSQKLCYVGFATIFQVQNYRDILYLPMPEHLKRIILV